MLRKMQREKLDLSYVFGEYESSLYTRPHALHRWRSVDGLADIAKL